MSKKERTSAFERLSSFYLRYVKILVTTLLQISLLLDKNLGDGQLTTVFFFCGATIVVSRSKTFILTGQTT